MGYKILIADDHSIIRSGIKALIKNNFVVSGVDEAGSEKEITEKIKSSYYDLVILDINIPGSDFVNQMNWIKAVSPNSRILVFTMHAEDIYGKRCLQLGAKGYLHKAEPNSEIIIAIKKILGGGTYINTKLQQLLSQSNDADTPANPFDKLSSRELEIAILINKGYSLSEICAGLNIQYSTANTYKRRILEKLDVPNAVSLTHLMQAFKVEGN